MSVNQESTFLPAFMRKLRSPACRNVLLCGCGGGFDFVHGMLLYPELIGLGKQVTIGSYSFGETEKIGEPANVVYQNDPALVKQVTANTGADPVYAPEIHLCSYLDAAHAHRSPHSIYAYYARDFTVTKLHEFYSQLVDEHDIDTVVLVDGGTDSLMVGDEAGLGDPIEDLTSIAAVDRLDKVRTKILLSVGFGLDRFNGVSDASSMRAVAELTHDGGFLGSISIERDSEPFRFYRAAVEHIHTRQRFASTVGGAIISAAEGYYGGDTVPPALSRKLTEKSRFHIWPLMSMIFGFDLPAVATRSRMPQWLARTDNLVESYKAISAGRNSFSELKSLEYLPDPEEMKGRFTVDFTSLSVVDRGTQDSSEDVEELAAVDETDDANEGKGAKEEQ